MNVFKLTNLMGTRRDPRRKRRSKLTRRPVRIGQIKLGPKRTIILDEKAYLKNKNVIDIYISEGILDVTSRNRSEFFELQKRTTEDRKKESLLISEAKEAVAEIKPQPHVVEEMMKAEDEAFLAQVEAAVKEVKSNPETTIVEAFEKAAVEIEAAPAVTQSVQEPQPDTIVEAKPTAKKKTTASKKKATKKKATRKKSARIKIEDD